MRMCQGVHCRNSLEIVNFNYFDKWHRALGAGKRVSVSHSAGFPHSLNNFRYMLRNTTLRQQLDLTSSLSYKFPSAIEKYKNALLDNKFVNVHCIRFPSLSHHLYRCIITYFIITRIEINQIVQNTGELLRDKTLFFQTLCIYDKDQTWLPVSKQVP